MSSAGRLFLVGSGQDGSLEKIGARALAETGKAAPRVAITYAPIADSPEGLRVMTRLAADVFQGATLEPFALQGEADAMEPERARVIVERADLVFVAGGDPVLGAKILRAAGADGWLRAAHTRGASMLGVSAGSIMLGTWWASWPDADASDARPLDEFANGTLVACTRVAPDLVIDCHDESSDWEELRLVKKMCDAKKIGDELRFVGIPTGGAIVVDSLGAHEIVGKEPLYLT